MSHGPLLRGTTSVILPFRADDASSTTGAGLTGLLYNSAGLVAEYWREGDTAWTTISLVSGTLGTWVSGGFKEDSGGHYELGLPNAALTQGKWVKVRLRGATNLVPVEILIQLWSLNPQDAVRGGMSALPNANAGAIGGLGVLDANSNLPVNVRRWLDAIPAALSANGYVQAMLLRWLTDNAAGTPSALQANRVDGYVGVNNDKSGYQLAAAQPAYAPAKAGDAMTLTPGERTAVANEVEAQIIDDTDSEKVLQAIVDKIAAVNPSLDDLTLGGIAAAVRDEVERVGGMLIGVKTRTDNLPDAPAAVGSPMTLAANAIDTAQLTAAAITAIQAGLSTLTQLQAQAAATAALNAYDPPTRAEATDDKQELLTAIGSPLQSNDVRLDTIAGAAEELAPLIEGGQFTVAALANGPAGAGGGGGGLTAQEVWEYDGPRTVTQPAAQLAAIDDAGTITVTRGVTVSIPFVDVPNLANRTKLWFTVKKRLAEEDSEAVIQIEETAGLLYLNGVAATGEEGAASAADGSLEVDAEAGTVTINLALTASERLPIGNNLYYDLKLLTEAGQIPAPVRGRLNVVSAVTLAVS